MLMETEAIDLTSTEPVPLDPELAACVEETPHGFKVLRHPLVVSAPYTDIPFMNDQLNKMLAHKRERLGEALDRLDANSYVFLHERPFRLEGLLTYRSLVNEKPEWYWPLLADVWVDAEDPDVNTPIYKGLFTLPLPDRHLLMEPGERAALRALPETMTVYRGAPHEHRRGLSWTPNIQVAYFFATRWGATDRIYQMQVRKADVLAYFTRRGEDELIVHHHAWEEPTAYLETANLSDADREFFKRDETERKLNRASDKLYGEMFGLLNYKKLEGWVHIDSVSTSQAEENGY